MEETITVDSKCYTCDNNNQDMFIYDGQVWCHDCLGNCLIEEALFFNWTQTLEDYVDNNGDEEE